MIEQPIVLRSVLSGSYLNELLSKRYSLGKWMTCDYLLRGLNDTYKVRTDEGLYALRIFREEVKEEQVRYELSLITKLADVLQDGITRVALPIHTADQQHYCIVPAPEGHRIAVLFEYVSVGEDSLNDEESCFKFGQSAAELHLAMDQVAIDLPKHDLDKDFLIHQSVERIINYVGKDHPQSDYLLEFANDLSQIIDLRVKQRIDWGICHEDMHGNNNAQFDKGIFTHIDFEWAAKGWRSYDLAQVLLSRRRHRPVEEAEVLWKAIMKGYRSIRSFSELDEEAVKDFAIVRRLWVMSLDAAFIDSDSGSLDYGDEWLNDFTNEFKQYISSR